MTIKALDALQKGYQRSINARIVVAVLYATNLLVALPFAYALRSTFAATVGQSLEPAVLTAGFDFTVISDYVRAHHQALGALYDTAAGALFAYLLVNVFLSGGIVAAVRRDGMSVTVPDVFAGAATYCGRFLRLALIVFSTGAVIVIPALIVVAAGISLWTEGAVSEVPGTIGYALFPLFAVLLMVPVIMVYDYARIDVVMTDATVMRRSAWRGVRFLYRRLGRASKLQLALMFLFLVLAALYLFLAEAIGTATPAALILAVLLQQLFVLQRMGLRVFGFAAESALYRELNPEGGGIPGWDMGHQWQ